MKTSEKITAYINKHPKWSEELQKIREVFSQSELTEAVKWGAPAYMLDNKIVAGLAGFKNHMGIWFHQGVFLKDEHNKLVNAQEGKTKALRQWRIEKGDEIDPTILAQYIAEATQNCKDGKELKPQTKKKLVISKELHDAFDNDTELLANFQKLTPGKQREYADYISEAKRATTKQSRLEKIAPMIKEGVGLNDKYKNC